MLSKLWIRDYLGQPAVFIEQADEKHVRMKVEGKELLITNEWWDILPAWSGKEPSSATAKKKPHA